MDIVEIIIFDECHHAQKKHPYAQIMKNYYHSQDLGSKPKIFGMTASPVQQKGVASSADCAKQIRKLEIMLDSKVYAIKDRTELQEFVPIPLQRTRFYGSSWSFESVRQKLRDLRDKCLGYDKKCAKGFADLEKLKLKADKEIRNLHNGLDHCLIDLGIWCALEAAHFFLNEEEGEFEESDKKLLHKSRHPFLEEVINLLEDASSGYKEELGKEADMDPVIMQSLITPKVHLLLQDLMRFRNKEDLRCIVFVDRVVVSIVLSRLVNHMKHMPNVKCDYMTGLNADHHSKTSRQQHDALQMFHSGKLNVLIATSVAEEGLDITSCSCVIRFDLCSTVRGYIQSRGRARHSESEYIVYIERGSKKQEDLLWELVKSEKSMREQAKIRSDIPLFSDFDDNGSQDKFRVESTGATIFSGSSIGFIYRYCSKLPHDQFYIPRPVLNIERVERTEKEVDLFKCTIYFPPNAPVNTVTGLTHCSKQLAKESACIEACKRLHSMGVLNDQLVEDEHSSNLSHELTSGSGTTKWKELHPSIRPSAFEGRWINKGETTLHAYQLTFLSQNLDDGSYCRFAILIDAKFDDDVANIEVDLSLGVDRMAKAKLSCLGELQISACELSAAKAFHEVLFNGMFGKMLLRKKNEHGTTSIECSFRWKETWSESNVYLVLPLIEREHFEINWKAVKSCETATRLFENICNVNRGSSLNYQSKRGLETAGGLVDVSQMKDCVIVTIHTGRIFCIQGISDENATSEFPDNSFATYAEYFEKAHARALKFPLQPLLMAKQTHKPHNLLITSKKDMDGESGRTGVVLIPPELCLFLDLDTSIVRSLYLLPSFIHRLSAMVSASELRNEIKKTIPSFPSVPAKYIMEALTTLRCLEGFSFEGLELLGDSYLKYAVTQYLFLVFQNNHEGQLSIQRSRAICNAVLHKLAVSRGLPGYIRDEVFQPTLWVAPGMHPRKMVECRCEMSNLVKEDDCELKGTDTEVFKIGKTCSSGHRWMCSKTIADVVEALIGVCLAEAGSACALDFMSWVGIECKFNTSLIHSAQQRACVSSNSMQTMLPIVESLESILKYTFKNKSLLIEAITHPSMQGQMCYQRLEFLGDAALDFVLTKHLFESHPGLSPGTMTDLRQAAVNNGCFARVAVRYNLQRYIQHASSELLNSITDFVSMHSSCGDCNKPSFGWKGAGPPKVLGDVVESVVGAILVDTSFNLEQVWGVIKPILLPLVTPETLPLHPVKEIQEICDFHKFGFMWEKIKRDGKFILYKGKVQLLEEEILESSEAKQKQAKKEVAEKLIKVLADRGIFHPRNGLVEDLRSHSPDEMHNRFGSSQEMEMESFGGGVSDESIIDNSSMLEHSSISNSGRTKEVIIQNGSHNSVEMRNILPSSSDEGIIDSIQVENTFDIMTLIRYGAAVSNLYEMCTKWKWEQPMFQMEECGGPEHKRWFTMSVTVHSDKGYVKEVSLQMPDKRKAKGDAATKMLGRLQTMGFEAFRGSKEGTKRKAGALIALVQKRQRS